MCRVVGDNGALAYTICQTHPEWERKESKNKNNEKQRWKKKKWKILIERKVVGAMRECKRRLDFLSLSLSLSFHGRSHPSDNLPRQWATIPTTNPEAIHPYTPAKINQYTCLLLSSWGSLNPKPNPRLRAPIPTKWTTEREREREDIMWHNGSSSLRKR